MVLANGTAKLDSHILCSPFSENISREETNRVAKCSQGGDYSELESSSPS